MTKNIKERGGEKCQTEGDSTRGKIKMSEMERLKRRVTEVRSERKRRRGTEVACERGKGR